MKYHKNGKRMNFSQSVLGTKSMRSKKPSVGKIVCASAGTVVENPPKKMGKRVF